MTADSGLFRLSAPQSSFQVEQDLPRLGVGGRSRIESDIKIKEDGRTSSENLLGERGLKVTFWGVRGSFPCPRLSHIRYGGNTSCVSVQCGNQSIVFDAGTGIRGFGQWLMQQSQRRLHVLLSHVHWDHINGFPFFDPVYKSDFNIHVWAGSLSQQGQSIQAIMSQQMQGPTFPILLESLPASLQFTDFKAGDTFDLEGGIRIRTTALAHPNHATAYRVEYQGASFCYVTDTEHREGTLDPGIISLIRGADLVVYDSTYTDAEYATRVGWGHSTWQEGVRLAVAADARRLAIFHHDPDHDDDFMDQVAAEAADLWPGAFVATEGAVIELTG